MLSSAGSLHILLNAWGRDKITGFGKRDVQLFADLPGDFFFTLLAERFGGDFHFEYVTVNHAHT